MRENVTMVEDMKVSLWRRLIYIPAQPRLERDNI